MDKEDQQKIEKLLHAARSGDNKSVEECLANGTNVNGKDKDKWTALHWAAKNGNKATVYLLILKGAAINSETRHFSPLHCAAGGYKEKVNDDKKHETLTNYIEIVDFLISIGAQIEAKDEIGNTPYDVATTEEMKKRLKAAQAGIDAGIPHELIHLDKKSVDDFKKLLREDSYELFELRSMLQGEQGTGKTTIARFLVGMGPTLFRKSTDGIELYTGLSFFDKDNNSWLGGKQDFTLEDVIVSRTFKDLKKPDLSKQQGPAPESSSRTEQNETQQQRTESISRDNPSNETNEDSIQTVIQGNSSHEQQDQTRLLEHEDNPTIIKNPCIIEKIMAFFKGNKEAPEIEISVTEDYLFQISRKVARKEFHKKKLVPVTIWDFGGQDVFYSTHQTFLTYRAVYMLILDGSRTLNESSKDDKDRFLPGTDGATKTQKDYVRFWINTIITYCKGGKPGFPKIMIILTHKDKLKGTTEIKKRRDEIFEEIEQMFGDSRIKDHLLIKDRIFVNARNNNDPEMETIKHSLIEQAQKQPTWGEKLPKCFLPLELEIQCLVKKGITIITFKKLKKINDHLAVRPLTDSELKTFLKFQHSVGKILYFDEPFLDEKIIISPTFLIDAFKSIITDKQFCKGDKHKEKAWYSMDKKGIILKQTIETVWKQKKYVHFFNSMTHLLGVMTHLDILVEPRRYDTNHCRILTEFYYVASMVRKQDKTGYLLSPTFSQRNIALSFETSSSIIPPALSFRFISYCLSIWGVKTYGDDNEEMLFHRSAVLTIDPSLDIHIKCEDERLIVRLVHARSRSLIMRDLASSIRECLSAALHKISQLYIKTSSEITENSIKTSREPREYIQSFDVKVCCSSSENPCFIAIQDISDVWICSCHQIEHGKDLVLSWFTEKGKEKCESFCPVTDPHFLKQTPTDLHLRRLALAYDTLEVKNLVIALGLPTQNWNDLETETIEQETLRFKAFKKCFKMNFFSFEKIKTAADNDSIRNPHNLCRVVRDKHVNFDKEPEKWDLLVTDEDIDKLSPVVGKDSLCFLIELGLTFSDWEQIEYSQRKSDLVKLNRNIMEVWRTKCKVHNIKPTLRTVGQAFENIGTNIKIIENMLFN